MVMAQNVNNDASEDSFIARGLGLCILLREQKRARPHEILTYLQCEITRMRERERRP